MRAELRWLVVAISCMLVGLVAELAVLSRAARTLETSNEVIVSNTAPSIVALDEAQARLHEFHMRVLERQASGAGDVQVSDASIGVARRALDDKIRDYLALPTDPGEAPLQEAIRESAERVHLVVDRTLAGAANGALARHNIDDAIARLSVDLVHAGAFNADLTRTAAKDLTASRSTLPLVAAIEALTSAAAVVTLALTHRSIRRAEALWNESRATLARRAEELELFAARVAHDLSSPLMAVSLAVDIAHARLARPEDASARNAVARAKRTLAQVRRFVSDLLEFARAGAKPAAGVHAGVEDAVREVVDELEPIARKAGVELRVEPGNEGAARDVACSPGVLMSAISNLVQNAIKYIGEGDVRRVSVRTGDDGGEVRVEVEDTGPGVPTADRERLFEPYTRGRDAKAPGIGLGLATVKRLVESHGGHVGVRAAPERGSVFWFSLPAAPSAG
jgi:signal transduction histidine kinase